MIFKKIYTPVIIILFTFLTWPNIDMAQNNVNTGKKGIINL